MLFELRQSIDAYDVVQKQVAECDRRLQTLMAELPKREAQAAVRALGDGVKPSVRKKKSTRNKKNVPRFDLKTELQRVCAVDLTSIDGST